jgi:ABC-2 type transport system ATP-binding protein
MDATQALAIDVKGLIVRYGRKEAVRGVDLAFAGGSLGLLGPNGAGKSSLIRALLGLVSPSGGSAHVLGIDARRRPLQVRGMIGYMPENEAYVPGLTGIEMVTYLGRLCGMSLREAQKRGHEVMLFCGLAEERYRAVAGYSRGMQQKARLAAALVHDPSLVFLDEPTNGLDPQARVEILRLIHDLGHEKGIHVVLSSHLLKDVEDVCEEVVVLDRGKVRLAGRIATLKAGGDGHRVRVAGDPEAFVAAATARGYRVDRDGREGLLVRVAAGVAPPPMRAMFELARESGVPLKAAAPLEESLEEIFLRSLAAGDDPA